MGGIHPPHQPKTNDFGQKISLYFEKLGSISGCIPPHQSKPHDFGRKSLSISVKTFFFFFFFGDHLILGGKNVRNSDFGRKITLNFGEDLFFFFFLEIFWRKNVPISDFGRKITLNFGEDIRIFEVLCLKSPPPKSSRSATESYCSRSFLMKK